MTSLAASDLFPSFPYELWPDLLAVACEENSENDIRALLQHAPLDKLSKEVMGRRAQNAIEALVRREEWRALADVLDVFPGEENAFRFHAWTTICELNKGSFGPYMEALNLACCEPYMTPMAVERRAWKAFAWLMQEKPDLVKDHFGSDGHRAYRHLLMAACQGPQAVQQIQTWLEDLPGFRFQHPGERHLAFHECLSEALRKSNEIPDYALETLLTYPDARPTKAWSNIFSNIEAVARVIDRPAVREALQEDFNHQVSHCKNGEVPEAMTWPEVGKLAELGMDILSAHAPDGRNTAHFLAQQSRNGMRWIVWLSLKAPHLLVERDHEGKLPCEYVNDPVAKILAQDLTNSAQSIDQQLRMENATAPALQKRAGPRL